MGRTRNGGRDEVIQNVAAVLLYLHGRRYMPDLDVMAAQCGMCRRSLYRYLNALERKGYRMPKRYRDG